MSIHSKRTSTPLHGSRPLRSGAQSWLGIGAGALLTLTAAAYPAQGSPATPTTAPAPLLPASPMQAPAATSSPAAAGAALDATDLTTLRGHLGESVEITGTPTGTGVNKAGTIYYLNFSRQKGGALTVVFFVSKGEANPAGGTGTKPASVDDFKPFVGKPVTVKGQLSDYKGDVQMVVSYLDQIKAR